MYEADTSTPPRRVMLAGSAAAQLAFELAGAKPTSANAVCTHELGPAVEVVFAYPDDHQSQGLAELYGCGLLHTAAGERVLPAAARQALQIIAHRG